MKVPIRWLKDYVDFDLSLGALVNRLALAGLEVSGINHWGLPAPEGLRLGAEDPYPVWDKDKIIIGLVTKVDNIPMQTGSNFPRLSMVRADRSPWLQGRPIFL